jgi:hypothetical protein
VRAGIRHSTARFVGYCDADRSTPASSFEHGLALRTLWSTGWSRGSADRMTIVLANGADATTSVRALGGGLGFSGIRGVAVALDTYLNAKNPSNNFVGLTYGPTPASIPDHLDWVSTNSEVPALRTINTITVSMLDGVLTVSVDGTQPLTTPVTVTPPVLLDNGVSNVSITST